MSGQHLQDQSLGESAAPSGVSSRTSFSNPRSSFIHGKKLPALRASTTGTAAEFLINAISPTSSLHQIMKEQKEAQQQQHNLAHRHLIQKAEKTEEVDDKPKLKFTQIAFKKKIVGDLFGTSSTNESLAGLLYRSRIIEKDEKKSHEIKHEEKAQLEDIEDSMEEDDENSDSENETRLLKSMNPKQQLAITIKNWSAFPENDEHLIKEGAVYALIALAHIDDTTIRRCCASAFYQLSSRDQNREELLSIGITNGVTTLAIPLGAHLSALTGRKWKIAKLCTLTLCHLSMQVDGEATMANEFAIMALMVLVGINGHLLLPICAQTMYNLTSCMHPFKGIERIIKLLLNTTLTGFDHSEILVKVLVNCARYSWLRLRIIEEGGIAQLHGLVPTLYNRENKKDLTYHMLIALRSLSESSGCRADMLQKGSVELLSNLLPIVQDEERCRLLIMKLLHNFIHPPTTISNQSFEVAVQIVTIITLHAHDDPTIQYCSACFNLFTKEKVRGMKHLAVLIISSMNKLLQSQDSLTQFFAISSAGNLFFNNLCDDPLKLEQLVKFFVINGAGITDPAAKQALALALAKLSQDNSYMDTIEKLDLLDRVLKLLMSLRYEHKDSLLLQESCCIAICRISLRLGINMTGEERDSVTHTLFDLLTFGDRNVLSSAISSIRALGVSGLCPDEFLKDNQFLSKIANIILRFRGDAELCRYGCAVLAVFSYDTQAHDRLAEKDIMGVLFANINSDDEITRELVANSLCNLSVHAVACQTMIDMNVVEVLGQLSCSTSETILDLCAKSLCNLTCNAELHKKMIDNNVLEIIIMIALVRTVSSQTKCTCAKALLNLVSDDNLPSIVVSGAIRVFATLSTSPFVPVQTVCSKGFHLLTLNEKRRQELVRNRAVAQALFHMVKCSTSSSSRVKIRLGISVINLLSCNTTSRDAIQAGALSCLKIVATMDFEELRDACARTILHMANDQLMHTLLFREPVVAILLLIIQRHKAPTTFELAMRALRCLSQIESFRRPFFRDQGFEALISAVYSGNVVRRSIAQEICKAWTNLSYVHEHADPMIRSGSLALALQILQQSHLASLSQTRMLLLVMVRNITDSSMAREYILLQGIFGSMVKVILEDFDGYNTSFHEDEEQTRKGITSIGYAAAVKIIYNLSLIHKLHEHLVSQGIMSAIQRIVFPLDGVENDFFDDLEENKSVGSLGSASGSISNVPFRFSAVDIRQEAKQASSSKSFINSPAVTPSVVPFSPSSSLGGAADHKHHNKQAPPSGTRLYFSHVEVELLAKTVRLLAESPACHEQMVFGRVMDIFKALIYSNLTPLGKCELSTALALISQSKACREALVNQAAVEMLIALSITSDSTTQAQCSVALGYLSEITRVSKGVVASLLLLGLNMEEGGLDFSDTQSIASSKTGGEPFDKISAGRVIDPNASITSHPKPPLKKMGSDLPLDPQKMASLKSLLRDLMQDKIRFDSFVDALKDSNHDNLDVNDFHPKTQMKVQQTLEQASVSSQRTIGRVSSVRLTGNADTAANNSAPVLASLINAQHTRLAVAENHKHLLHAEELALLKSSEDPMYYFEVPESNDSYTPESGGLSRKLTVELPLPGIPTDRDLEPANRHKELNAMPVDQNPLPKDCRTPVFMEHHRHASDAHINSGKFSEMLEAGYGAAGSDRESTPTTTSMNVAKKKIKGRNSPGKDAPGSPHTRSFGKLGRQNSGNKGFASLNIDPRSPLLKSSSGLFSQQQTGSRLASPMSRGNSKGSKQRQLSRGESSGSMTKSHASEKESASSVVSGGIAAAAAAAAEANDDAANMNGGRESAGFGIGDEEEGSGDNYDLRQEQLREKEMLEASRLHVKGKLASSANLYADDRGPPAGLGKLGRGASSKFLDGEDGPSASLPMKMASRRGSFATRSSFSSAT